MNNAYVMSQDSFRSYNRWHGILGLILAALLLLLPWLTNGRIGPHGWKACAAAATPSAAAPAAVAPAALPAPAVAPPPARVAAVAVPPPMARVYFGSNKTNLPQDVGNTLAPVLAYLGATPSAKVLLSGFHDPQGNVAHNQQLALDRARAVREALQQAGIAPDRVVMSKPAETTGSGDKQEARRVEVSIQP